MTARSSNYVCTVAANDPQLPQILAKIRSEIKIHNAKRRAFELENPEIVHYTWSGRQEVRKRAYLRVRGRLGKNNPNAELYRLGGKLHTWTSQDIRPEHSQWFDIYVAERRNYVDAPEEVEVIDSQD